MPRFDVLMPVKNGGDYLQLAISSIQSQTVKDWRLLVLDHGSTDSTLHVVRKMAQQDPRIVLHEFPQAAGLAGLLNEGLNLVDAEFTMRMDADDQSLPDRMALTQAAFTNDSQAMLIGGQAHMMNASGQPMGEMAVPCDADAIARTALFRNPVIHPAVTFRSEFFRNQHIRYGQSRQLGADGTKLQMPSLAEDYLLFGELAIEGAVKNLPNPLIKYRFHSGGVGRQKLVDQIGASVKISRYLAFRLSQTSGLPPFDPAPFCTHGETLVDIESQPSHHGAYQQMEDTLSKAGGAWRHASSQIGWRKVFVDRSALGIVSRALWMAPRSRPDQHEIRTVRNVVTRILRGKSLINVVPFQNELRPFSPTTSYIC